MSSRRSLSGTQGRPECAPWSDSSVRFADSPQSSCWKRKERKQLPTASKASRERLHHSAGPEPTGTTPTKRMAWT
eukprot:9197727-Prorocentrum_lima.AAC.1